MCTNTSRVPSVEGPGESRVKLWLWDPRLNMLTKGFGKIITVTKNTVCKTSCVGNS